MESPINLPNEIIEQILNEIDDPEEYLTIVEIHYGKDERFNQLKTICDKLSVKLVDQIKTNKCSVELLKLQWNDVLIEATRNGYKDLIKILLKHPKVTPTYKNYKAVKIASKYGYGEILEIFLQDKRVIEEDLNWGVDIANLNCNITKITDNEFKKCPPNIHLLNCSNNNLTKLKRTPTKHDYLDIFNAKNNPRNKFHSKKK